MPWYFPWSDSIKKRACRYLLQHYLGHFLQEKLTLEQLTVDLYNGTGKVENVPLDMWSVNEMLESASIPFELVEGYIESIEIGVPWMALLNDNCTMNIKGLELTITPRQPHNDSAASMTESMIWNTMTTSMQLAQECLKQGPSPGEEQAEVSQPFEGLESFAQTIESVLSRIKVSFTDTIIRLEYLPKETKAGIAVEIHIKGIDYTDLSTKLAEDDSHFKANSVYERAAFACKNLKIFGVSVHMNEFRETGKSVQMSSADSFPPSPDSNASSPPISPTYYGLSNHKFEADQHIIALEMTNLLPSVKIACCTGNQEVKVKLKQNLAVPGPKIDVECFLGTMNVFLSPRQVYLLLEIANGLKSPDSSVQSDIRGKAVSKPMQPEDYQRIEQDLHNQLLGKKTFRHHEGQQRVDSWNFSMDSFTSAAEDNPSRGTDYDSLLSDDGEDKFYSMASGSHSADILPPLEEPLLPADMVMRKGNTSEVSPSVLDAIAGQRMKYHDNYVVTHSKMNIKGSSLTEAASSIFISSQHASPLQPGQSQAHSARKVSPPCLSKTFSPPSLPGPPGLAGIAALEDPSPEQFKVRVQLSSLAVTLLHVDPVLSPPSSATSWPENPRTEADHPLTQMTEHFYKTVGTCRFGQNDFEDMKDTFNEACSCDHLRCLIAPLSLEFERTSSSSCQEVRSEVSIGKMEVMECLYERSSNGCAETPYSTSQLLSFVGGNERPTWHIGLGTTNAAIPCLRASFKSVQRTSSPSGVQARNTLQPKTELTLQMGKLYSEVDISIIDRLMALIHPQPLYPTQSSSSHTRMLKSLNPSAANQQAVFTQAIDEGPTGDQRTSIHMSCPALTFVLRFPIPDLRPVVDRRPWWKQSLRDEQITFDFSAVEFKTTVSGADSTCDLEFRFRELEGHFQLSPRHDSLPVIHVSPCQIDNEAGNGGFDWPRLVVSVRPRVPLSVLEEVASANNSPLSSLEAYPVMKAEPSPFSSKSVMYETPEELVMPGSQEEMAKFQEDTISNSKVHIECSFPQLDVNLHTKDVFEQIYNRIASDLFLWEPTAPSPVERVDPYENSIGTGLDLASQLLQAQGPDKFVMCKSGIRDNDSWSDGEESSSFNSPDHKTKRSPPSPLGQSFLALTINIMKGRAALFPGSQELPGSKEEESHAPKEGNDECDPSATRSLGEQMIELDDSSFFLVACYKGQVDLSYLCLQSKKARLFHAPLVHPELHKSMELTFSGAELQSTIHPSEAGILGTSSNPGEPMLALSLKSSFDSVKNAKEILFAVGLRDGTLRHRILPASDTWLNQVMNYMDVKDDVILGFIPPAVVTVFHAHLWNCAVDYRPIHLPLRLLLTMEAFSISSNITIESTVSVLRFIVEDAALHLSDRCSGPSELKNYVCIMDLGLFELSLFMSDGSERRHPKLELRMSNNTLNIRTCADSCSAFLQLIQYIAADGDLVPQYTTEEEDDDKLGTSKKSRTSSDPPVKQISVDESEMSSLMKEAMVDAVSDDIAPLSRKGSKSDLSRQISRSPKPDLFLFPDDQQSQVEERLNELHFNENCFGECEEQGEEQEDSEEEFCILEHPEREVEANLSDEVIIKSLVDEKVNIVENHFMMPFGRGDQLRAPDHYPPAVYRYKLKEMTVVWQLFGGRDFGTCAEDTSKKKRITFALDESRRQEDQSFHRRPTQPVGFSSPYQTRLGPRSRAGRERDNNVLMELQLNKIRFQYEKYPEDTEKASRLVLLAQDVEIRDRLAHSQINKFLYQYTSESMPKQTHANMVMFKMLYIRPEPTNLKAEECCLRVSIQPLRLNIDQDALFFLKDFFTEIADGASKKGKGSNSVQSSPAKSFSNSPSPQLVQRDLLLESPDPEEPLTFISVPEPAKDKCDSSVPPTFFRSFVFAPEVPIRLDYQGKRVDMDQGTFAGILIGLGQLNCSELKLKRLSCRSGLLGFDKVINYALNEWLSDIKSSQLPSILGGVGPVHSVVQLFQGMVDLVWLPIDQYRRDGRVMRGLQRGANSFTTSSAMAFLELTNRVVQTVQSAAETAYDMVSPGPSVVPTRHGRHRLANQPADLREGVAKAYHVVTEGVGRTATNIVKVAREEHEEKGVTGAVGGVLRQLPPTIVQPVILATQATSSVLGGVRNQLLPDARREAAEKWRQTDHTL